MGYSKGGLVILGMRLQLKYDTLFLSRMHADVVWEYDGALFVVMTNAIFQCPVGI